MCVPPLADFVSVDLLDPHEHGGEPAPGRTAGRSAPHRPPVDHRGPLAGGGRDRAAGRLSGRLPQAECLLSGQVIVASEAYGDLERWLQWDPARLRRVKEYGIHSTMSVPLQARGTTLGVAVFTRFRRPDPFTHDDVLLAEEVSARAAVCIDNARRYSREREATLTLQRSLLPGGCRPPPRCRRPRAIFPRPARASAATGSTSSPCPGCGSPWSSGTSSATASRPRPRWADCAPPCAPSPTST